jgi:hypothetical protein
MKTLPFLVFALAALAQWLLPLSGIWQNEQILEHGTLIKIQCAAPDPYDPLRGRYLAVQPAQTEAPVPDGLELTPGQTVFATLTPDASGLSSITSLSLTPPATGDFIRMKTRWVNGSNARLNWPFDRFYLNEKLAPEADQWFAENIRSASGIIAEVRVHNGRAVLADLSLNGKPFRDLLHQRLSP